MKIYALLIAGFACFAASACRQDMHNQPKNKAFTESDFFKDHRSARPHVPGTVARGHLDESDAFCRGKVDGKPVETFPAELIEKFGGKGADWREAMMARGRDRYQIHCTPCHGSVGDGNGMVVLRGMRRPTSFHIDRLQKSPPGYFFDVIGNGFGAMFDLADRIPKYEDRWAIVAYVRALQTSQNATLADVPKEYVSELDNPRPRTDGQVHSSEMSTGHGTSAPVHSGSDEHEKH